jgi:hypothetical protein
VILSLKTFFDKPWELYYNGLNMKALRVVIHKIIKSKDSDKMSGKGCKLPK